MLAIVGAAVAQHHSSIRRYRRDTVPGGIDFSACKNDPDTGLCCVDKEEQVTTLKKDPILECTHKNTEQCHFTYVTKFKPSQEQVCEENFEKSCQITFKQQAFNETVKKCYKPTAKVLEKLLKNKSLSLTNQNKTNPFLYSYY